MQIIPEIIINAAVKNPPSIAIAFGAIGLLLGMPNAGFIFFGGMVMQFGWLFFMR